MNVERLAGTDLSMLWPDDLGWPQDIGGLAIVAGHHLLDEHGLLPLEKLRSHIVSKLWALPRFRQVLRRPGFGCGRPYWTDDVQFDIDHHVQVLDASEVPGTCGLLEACELLRGRPFDTSRPLWCLWFLTDFEEGRVGVFVKVHHTLADGAAGVAALAALFDLSPREPTLEGVSWTPNRPPSTSLLVVDHVRAGWRRCGVLLRSLLHPRAGVRRIARTWSAVRGIAAASSAPRLSFNRPIGDRRRLAVIRTDLALVKAIAHLRNGTVNDVLLSVIAGGLRRLLDGRGELGTDRPRAAIPIAGQLSPANGNTTSSSLVVPLAADESDPMRRLESTVAETRLRKRQPLSYDDAGILHSPLLERVAARFAGRQRVANLYVANVQGPPTPFFVATAPILELIPIVPLVGNVAIGVGALSYAGQFTMTVVADHDLCPDIDRFVDGMEKSVAELVAALETWHPPR